MEEEISNQQIKKDDNFETIKSALITKFLAEKLKKETELVKYNNSILNVKYLNLRRKEKSEEILKNINELKHIAEKFLNFKSKIESIFEQNFQNDQDINLFIFSNFIFTKDKLIANFVQSIDTLRQDFVKRVQEIKIQFEIDRTNIEDSYSNHKKIINDQILALEANFYYELVEDQNKFTKAKESLNCEHLDQIITLRVNMEKKITNLQRAYEDNKKSIESEIFFFSKPDEISSKNEKIEAEIQKDRLKIESLIDKCQSLREEINLIDIDFLLLNKKNTIHEKFNQYAQLNQQFEQRKKIVKKKIVNVIKSSSQAMTRLQSQSEKCRKILAYFSMCRKMETVEEKETLFCKSNVVSENIDWKAVLGNEDQSESSFIEDMLAQYMNDNGYNFYLKYAKVNIELESLKLVKSDLERENFFLKNYLKNYISSIEINCCL
ncbi:coiled-coil domain-containing 65 isoform X1 [Brachionus plicatilis]|uniref:Coiled-coil domain-containing 65 isoform X1 n=1 Tax=Brachionus plicatilis TaxID=10195 RepID=A0A3M7STG6_BRAPC|nr:coiled-coil domain-containing 65 isoform X1 [Brachionus plicatilis]